MKHLFIVRHGKSSWDFDSVADIDRPLKERGISDAYKMAGRLKKKGLIPALIITSNATRACHSALIFHRVLGLSPETFKIDPHLYHAGAEEIFNVVYGVNDRYDSLMLFGHNPGFTELANDLSRLSIMNIPTTGIVSLDFDIEKWNRIGAGKVVNESYDFPRKN